MVMFHADIGYATRTYRGEIQKKLLHEFSDDAETLDEVDTEAAIRAARERLPPQADVKVDRTL